MKTVCKQCGSGDVTVTVVVNPNDTTTISDYCHRDETITEDGWCNRCDDYVELEIVGDDEPPADPWRCERCGSSDVQQQAWVRPDTGEVVSFNDCDRGDYWCEPCGEHPRLVRESELMATIEKWFTGDLRPDGDEVISGLTRNDFASDEAFETACKEKWDTRDVESKIGIWRELTRDKSNES